jgi:hypothetical protein
LRAYDVSCKKWGAFLGWGAACGFLTNHAPLTGTMADGQWCSKPGKTSQWWTGKIPRNGAVDNAQSGGGFAKEAGAKHLRDQRPQALGTVHPV